MVVLPLFSADVCPAQLVTVQPLPTEKVTWYHVSHPTQAKNSSFKATPA